MFEYCLSQLPGHPVWVAEAWRYIVKKVFKYIEDIINLTVGLENLSVNCSGAQMPMTMIANICIIAAISFLLNSKVYPLIRLTAGSMSKVFKGNLKMQVVVTALVVAGEGCFRMLIQLACSSIDLTLQWYDHTVSYRGLA